MSKVFAESFVLAAVLVTLGTNKVSAQSANAPTLQTAKLPDPELFTFYSVNPGNQTVDWTTCSGQQHTCNPSGTLGPFGMVGYLMDGNPVRGKAGARDVYVLDTAAGKDKGGVTLNVYERGMSGSIGERPKARLELPLVGGSRATISMATHSEYIFVGSSLSQDLVQVGKRNYEIFTIPSFFFGLPYSGMTSNGRFVDVVQGGDGFPDSFTIYDKNGNVAVDGSGATFLLNDKTVTKPPQP
jgi:hypothetical protein